MAYRFGAPSLITMRGNALVDGAEIHLSPKRPSSTIAIRTRSRAVSKQELREHLWPATFVDEAGLASLAAEIRRALGDPARAPVFSRTMHRFGYRFVGDIVEPVGGPSDSMSGVREPQVGVEGANVTRRTDATISVARAPRAHCPVFAVGNHPGAIPREQETHLSSRQAHHVRAPLSDGRRDSNRQGAADSFELRHLPT